MVMDLYAWTPELSVTVVGIGLSIAGIIAAIMFAMSSILAKKFSDRFALLVFGLIPIAVGVFVHIPMGSTLPTVRNCTEIATNNLISSNQNLSEYFIIDHLGNETESILSNITDEKLNRHKRHAPSLPENKHCTDGCPAEQKWCSTTPIVEMAQMVIADIIITIGYSVAFALSSAIFSKLLGPNPQGVWMGILTSCGSFSRMVGPICITYMYISSGPRWTFVSLFIIVSIVIGLISCNYKRLVPMKISDSEDNEQSKY